MPTVVTRFAPSPTGYLHVGGARTALFNWLLARNQGGKFLLRIEDTDLARSTEDATRQLVEDLRWLGLQWDNAEPVFQSRRLATYNRVIEDLISRNLAYEAWETPDELDNMRQHAEKAKRAFIYRRREYSADELRRFRDEGRAPVIRFAMPVMEYRFRDEVIDKDVVLHPAEAQDFVIRKTDGMPTYHFGVVVDDAEMGITHILRGQEHLKNTFNHVALQEALGYPRPVYAHLSVMLNPETGEKLSKRDRDRRIRKRMQEIIKSTKTPAGELASSSGLTPDRIDAWLRTDAMQLDLNEQLAVMRTLGMKESDLPEIMVHDFRRAGYVPSVLLNFLALQGWSPGGDREQMSVDEMLQLFTLDRINPANPRFSRDKLVAFSTDYFAGKKPGELVSAMRDYLAANPDSPVNQASDEQLTQLLEMKKGSASSAMSTSRADFSSSVTSRSLTTPWRWRRCSGSRPGSTLCAPSAPSWSKFSHGKPALWRRLLNRSASPATWVWAKSPSLSAWPSVAQPSARPSSRASNFSAASRPWHASIAASTRRADPRRNGRTKFTCLTDSGGVPLPAAVHSNVVLVQGPDHFNRVVLNGMLKAAVSLDIMTADFKAMLVPTGSPRARSIVHHFRTLAAVGVEIRLLHAGTPSDAALQELKRELPSGLTIRRCPRLHSKAVVVDCRAMYLGSANLTGAGLGAKADGKRNFELGIWTTNQSLIDPVLDSFNSLWEGHDCATCRRKDVCPVPLEEPKL